MSRSKITHRSLCVACNIDLGSITADQPGAMHAEMASSLQVNVGDLTSSPDPTTVENMVGTATSASLTHVSTTTETETRNETDNMLTSTENVPPSTASVELKDEAAPKETSRRGHLKNVPKRKFIGECVCGNPVTVEEMDDEEKTICCKRKGCETS